MHNYNKLLPIIEYLETYDSITPQEAERVCGKSAATVRRYLKSLVGKENYGKNKIFKYFSTQHLTVLTTCVILRLEQRKLHKFRKEERL